MTAKPLAIWTLGGFEVDSSELPLVDVRFPEMVEREAYRQLFLHYVELAGRAEGIVWRIDFRRCNPVLIKASSRRDAADVFAEHRRPLMASTLCEVRVCPGLLARNILTAFDWITDKNWPTANVASFDEADAWIAKQRSLRDPH